jgi:hypothetical protein
MQNFCLHFLNKIKKLSLLVKICFDFFTLLIIFGSDTLAILSKSIAFKTNFLLSGKQAYLKRNYIWKKREQND